MISRRGVRERDRRYGGRVISRARAADHEAVAHRVSVGELAGSTQNGGRVGRVRTAIRELGYSEGQNVILDPRFAEGKMDRIPQLASDVVSPS